MSLHPTPLIASDCAYVRAAGQVSAELEHEVAILQTDSGLYFSLSEVGARIWELLAEPTSAQALTAALLADYEVAPERCASDVEQLLEQLFENRLIQICETNV